MQILIDDLRHAIRFYGKTPFQTLALVIVIAVPVAISASLLSLFQDLSSLSEPNIASPENVVAIGLTDGESFDPVPNSLLQVVRERSQALESLITQNIASVEMEVDGSRRNESLMLVDGDYFSTLGLRAEHGRVLDASDNDHDGNTALVLSHEFWARHFASDPDIVGTSIEIEELRFHIVGVLEQGFDGLYPQDSAGVYAPFRAYGVQAMEWSEGLLQEFPAQPSGRLRSSATVNQLNEELSALESSLGQEYAQQFAGKQLQAITDLSRDPHQLRQAQRQILLLLAIAVLLAITAAGNLGLFFLSRTPSRQREMAIRYSIGASRGRLFRQLLTESTFLVVLGAALALLLSLAIVGLLARLPMVEGVSGLATASLNWPAFLLTVLLTACLALLSGLVPGLKVIRNAGTINTKAARLSLGHRLIVAFQVGFATVICTLAMLVGHSVWQMVQEDPGFESEGIQVVEPQIDIEGDFSPSMDDVIALRQEIRDRLLPMETVSDVAFAGVVPAIAPPEQRTVYTEDDREIVSNLAQVSPQWVGVLSVDVLRGQLPEQGAGDKILVSRHFAERVWGSLDVVGKFVIAPPMMGGTFMGMEDRPHQVAAVVEDAVFSGPGEAVRPTAYLSSPGVLDSANLILVRGEIDEGELDRILRPMLADANPPLRLEGIKDLSAQWRATMEDDLSRSMLIGSGAFIVLALALTGFVSVLRMYLDGSRREFALRAAIGASPSRVFWHIMARGAWLGVPGMLAGLVLAAIAVSGLRDYLSLYATSLSLALLLSLLLMGSMLLLTIYPAASRARAWNPGLMLRQE